MGNIWGGDNNGLLILKESHYLGDSYLVLLVHK